MKKLIALLLTAILLVSLLPVTALAVNLDLPPGYGNAVTNPTPTPYDPGPTCPNCGSQNYRPNGNRKEPTCTEDGYVIVGSCPVEGVIETVLPALGHAWGKWNVVKEATPKERGKEVRYCGRCGISQTRYIDYVFPSIDEVEVLKKVTSQPANGKYYEEGEQISYMVSILHNGRRYVLTNVSLVDPLLGPGEVSISGSEGTATLSYEYTYTVTREDVEAGYVENTATFKWNFFMEEARLEKSTNTVTVPTGRDDRSEVPLDAITVTKTETSSPANGEYYVEGETITYAIHVTVAANPNIVNPVLYDRLTSEPLCYLEGIQTVGGSQVATFEYTVTAEDVEAGFVQNNAWVNWKDTDGGEHETFSRSIISTTGKDDDGDTTIAPPIVVKVCTSTPANGKFYTKGETITYNVTVLNPMNGDAISHITVWDEIHNSEAIVHKEHYIDYMTADNSQIVEFTHTVTSIDVEQGYVTNAAGMVYNDADGNVNSAGPVYCTVPTGKDDTSDYALSVTKSVLGAPANGSFYTPGETVTFFIHVTNIGNKELTGLSVYDSLNGLNSLGWIPRLSPNQNADWLYEYTVTELDAQAGWIYNTASAYAGTTDGEGIWVDSNTVAVPTGCNAFGVITEASLYKTETSTPKNGKYYTKGETITYTVTLTNTGETPFGECIVYDVLGGKNFEIGSAEMLNVGQTRTFEVSHKVTAADVKAGYVANSAVASCDNSGFGYTVTSNTVVSDTDGKSDEGVTPPELPDGLTTPWTPGSPPPSGNIEGGGKLSGQKNKKDYCKCTLAEHGEGSWEYQLDFCSIHKATGKSVDELLNTAADDDQKLQMIQMGRELWEADIIEIYEALIKRADTLGKTTVMEEQINFYNLVQNAEAMYTALYPSDPVKVGMLVLDMLEDHCNRLCYELHTASKAPADSLEFTPDVAATHGEQCATERNDVKNSVVYNQILCADHLILDTTAGILMKNSTTARAWVSTCNLWFGQMQDSYNELYASLDGKAKESVGHYYTALISYAESREKLLNALYDDDTAISQGMTKLLRSWTMDACALTQKTESVEKGFNRQPGGKRA